MSIPTPAERVTVVRVASTSPVPAIDQGSADWICLVRQDADVDPGDAGPLVGLAATGADIAAAGHPMGRGESLVARACGITFRQHITSALLPRDVALALLPKIEARGSLFFNELVELGAAGGLHILQVPAVGAAPAGAMTVRWLAELVALRRRVGRARDAAARRHLLEAPPVGMLQWLSSRPRRGRGLGTALAAILGLAAGAAVLLAFPVAAVGITRVADHLRLTPGGPFSGKPRVAALSLTAVVVAAAAVVGAALSWLNRSAARSATRRRQ